MQQAGGSPCEEREVRCVRSERFARCHAGGPLREEREIHAKSSKYVASRCVDEPYARFRTIDLSLPFSHLDFYEIKEAHTRRNHAKSRMRVTILCGSGTKARFSANEQAPPPLCARQNSFSGSPTTRSALRREARGETSCGARRRLRSCFGSETPSSRRSGEPLSPARRRRRAVVWSMRSSESPDPGTRSRAGRHGADCVPPHEALRHGSPRSLFSRDTRTACPPQHTERFGRPPPRVGHR